MIKIETIATLDLNDLRLIYQGFHLKWERLLKNVSFKEFCRLYQGTESQESCYRVLYNGELAGVFALSGSFSKKKVSQTKKNDCGDWRWQVGQALLSEKVLPNECYLSFLVIGDKFQGKGLGKACLAYMEEFALKDSQLDYLTLFVSATNQQARHLYQKVGFTLDKRIHSFLTSYFLGEKNWIKMKKKIS